MVYMTPFQLLGFNYVRGIKNIALELSDRLIWIKVVLYVGKSVLERKQEINLS